MNKTIKQAERYEAPVIKEFSLCSRTSILADSLGGNFNDFHEEETDWN